MENEDLINLISEIIGISEKFPERYRVDLFKTLLDFKLKSSGHESLSKPQEIEKLDFKLSPQLRVFLKKYEIEENKITEIFLIEDSKVHFVLEPKFENVAQMQIDWSLLIGLKNCIEKGKFEVDPKEVRVVCQEKGCYDLNNFSANLKKRKSLYKGEMESQGEPQLLSDVGLSELAKLINTIA